MFTSKTGRPAFAAAGLALAALLAAGGCDSQKTASDEKVLVADSMEQTALQEVGSLFKMHIDERKKPPARVADFAAYGPGVPFGFDFLNRGDIVAFWNVTPSDAQAGSVLAYEKKVPSAGGFVLMADGKTVKSMTADEFKAAPKAGAGDSPEAKP